MIKRVLASDQDRSVADIKVVKMDFESLLSVVNLLSL
jgi:hypothetical protein